MTEPPSAVVSPPPKPAIPVVLPPALTVGQRIALARRNVAGSFGYRLAPLLVSLGYRLVRGLGSACMALDGLLYRRLATVEVRAPIVIIGNPRTGTTFLQRWLHDHGVARGQQLYRMLYPSLLQQAVLTPLMPLIRKVDPTRFHATSAHKTSIDAVETDDAAFLARFADGFLFYAFFLSHAQEDLLALVDPDTRDTTARDFALLEELWKRSLLSSPRGPEDERVLAKLFSLSVRVPAFQARFPQARLLYMARDPLDQVPSTLSLITGVLDNAFGLKSRDPALQRRIVERVYTALLQLAARFTEDWQQGRIDRDGVFIVRFDLLMADFEGTMAQLLDFVGVEASEALQAEIDARGTKQRAYVSKHSYDLEEYGLSEERIRRDWAFFYEEFLPERPAT